MSLLHLTIKHKLVATFISAQAPSKTAGATRRNICKQRSAGRDSSTRLAFIGGRSRRLLELGVVRENLPPEQGEGGQQPRRRGQKEEETQKWTVAPPACSWPKKKQFSIRAQKIVLFKSRN